MGDDMRTIPRPVPLGDVDVAAQYDDQARSDASGLGKRISRFERSVLPEPPYALDLVLIQHGKHLVLPLRDDRLDFRSHARSVLAFQTGPYRPLAS